MRASKSLIEDEDELSDWVSDLRTSPFRGRITSENESDSDGARRRVRGRNQDRSRSRERSREGFSTKRRRDNISDEFGESDRRRVRNQADSFSRNSRTSERFDNGITRGDEDTFRRKRVGNKHLMNERRGGREIDSGFRRDRKGLKGKNGFVDDEEGDGDIDERMYERKELMEHLGDMVDEEESDDADEDVHDDGILKKRPSSSFDLAKERASSPRKSESYLSESRYVHVKLSLWACNKTSKHVKFNLESHLAVNYGLKISRSNAYA